MNAAASISCHPTCIEGCKVITPAVFSDQRGYFLEAWSGNWRIPLGSDVTFVQDNQSRSLRNVLRGLHYQAGSAAQAKLVWVTTGRVFDVVVDLRQRSKSFGKWFGRYLDADSCERIWIPEGCAHGFLVVSEHADFQYKVTKPYSPMQERSLNWKDPFLSIRWPLPPGQMPILSSKDAAAPDFQSCEKFG